jgi:hypothetical protein
VFYSGNRLNKDFLLDKRWNSGKIRLLKRAMKVRGQAKVNYDEKAGWRVVYGKNRDFHFFSNQLPLQFHLFG